MLLTNRTILLVEDNEDDVFLMRRAIKEAEITNPLFRVEDGQAAIDYLSGTRPFNDRVEFPLPSIVFLDLKLPFKSGHEVLAWIRRQAQFETLVVVVLTSSNEPVDIRRAYQLGANSYVVKPPTVDDLVGLTKAFKGFWLRYNEFDPRCTAA